MIGIIVAIAVVALLLVPVTFIQILYLEAMRLRAREYASLTWFREHLEERIGFKPERGALAFSLIKHSLVSLIGVLAFAVAAWHGLQWPVIFEATLIAWLLMVSSVYVLPHLLYRRTTGAWLIPLYPVIRLLAFVVRPLLALFEFLQSLAELSEPEQKAEENGTTAENIEALISAGAEEGIIEEDDRKLLQSVVEFGDKTVRAVMTPRPNIVAIGADETLEDLRQLVIHEQYSRIPVYQDSIDTILGFIHVRDMFELGNEERASRKAREIARPIRHVPETKSVSDLLREMQQDGAHMTMVVDEYGNTAGLATMEDLVEELVGEIRDEHEPGRDVTPDGDGAFIVSGNFDLDGLSELLQFRPPDGIESTTIGGLVTEWLGRVPAAGESVEREGIRIDVLAGNELRVEQVRVARIPVVKDA